MIFWVIFHDRTRDGRLLQCVIRCLRDERHVQCLVFRWAVVALNGGLMNNQLIRARRRAVVVK